MNISQFSSKLGAYLMNVFQSSSLGQEVQCIIVIQFIRFSSTDLDV